MGVVASAVEREFNRAGDQCQVEIENACNCVSQPVHQDDAVDSYVPGGRPGMLMSEAAGVPVNVSEDGDPGTRFICESGDKLGGPKLEAVPLGGESRQRGFVLEATANQGVSKGMSDTRSMPQSSATAPAGFKGSLSPPAGGAGFADGSTPSASPGSFQLPGSAQALPTATNHRSFSPSVPSLLQHQRHVGPAIFARAPVSPAALPATTNQVGATQFGPCRGSGPVASLPQRRVRGPSVSPPPPPHPHGIDSKGVMGNPALIHGCGVQSAQQPRIQQPPVPLAAVSVADDTDGVPPMYEEVEVKVLESETPYKPSLVRTDPYAAFEREARQPRMDDVRPGAAARQQAASLAAFAVGPAQVPETPTLGQASSAREEILRMMEEQRRESLIVDLRLETAVHQVRRILKH